MDGVTMAIIGGGAGIVVIGFVIVVFLFLRWRNRNSEVAKHPIQHTDDDGVSQSGSAVSEMSSVGHDKSNMKLENLSDDEGD